MKRQEGEVANGNATAQAAEKYLLPVIEGARQRYGGQIVLAELLSKRAGVEVSRYSVNRWLHADRDKRLQPTLGMGILLREVFNANKSKICSPWNATKRRKPRGKNKNQMKRKDTNGKPTEDAANTQAGASISDS